MYNNSNNTAARVSIAEQIGRDKFISIHSGTTWTPMPERYDVVDLTGATHINMFVEIKNREIKSSAYSTSFLELSKFENLIDLTKTHTGKAFYFVNYVDGKSFLFDLSKIKENQYPVKKIWCNDITIGDNEPKFVLKDMIELPLIDAVRRYI